MGHQDQLELSQNKPLTFWVNFCRGACLSSCVCSRPTLKNNVHKRQDSFWENVWVVCWRKRKKFTMRTWLSQIILYFSPEFCAECGELAYQRRTVYILLFHHITFPSSPKWPNLFQGYEKLFSKQEMILGNWAPATLRFKGRVNSDVKCKGNTEWPPHFHYDFKENISQKPDHPGSQDSIEPQSL